jgi:DNA-binding transcriptional MerR regulator
MTTTTKIPDRLYFRIGDVAELIGVKPYVLRYWESEFPMISPEKSPSGQRVYRRTDVETVMLIKQLLYTERYSIEGARKRISELRKHGELKLAKKAAGSTPAAVNSPGLTVEVKNALTEIRDFLSSHTVETLFGA